MSDPFIVLEAIHSVALSHDEGCRCTTCRAADGDQAAIAQIFAAVANPERAVRERGEQE